ncbi:IS110 family transposase [Paenibacillus baekrokdamisoli]|uniref:IS110 family transposase n=1 Tax=Paenibacillus baekrokdamisoli TaxID=1712516 RepID=A0A3G9J0J2_9BACL|nr:IS110 family transposase [Paenibacillus baekrokdamisoli]BBH24062.1 IS110 family transposase [Paenibacillus baekrokdamisoli]
MNPVIGLDVSKGESHAQAFSDRGTPYGKTFRFKHDLDGLASFLRYLQDLESFTRQRPAVVLEATGHYHSPVIQFLDEHPYLYIIINPFLSHQAKKSQLRKVKTDVADAYQLGEMFYKEELEPYKKRGQYLMNLRYLTRQYESLTGMYVQAKLQFQAVLDQVFPEYHGVFGDLYSKVSLRFLALYPTSQSVLAMSENDVTVRIQHLVGHVNSNRWSLERAQKLIAAAERNPFRETAFPSHLIALELLINLLLQYQEHLAKLDQSIEALAEELQEYDLVQSIPGIGTKIAATILAEIGEIDRFDHAKKLVAFAGIDPSVFASGKFTATRNKITKRGSRRLRTALYQAVRCGLKGSRNKRIRAYYDKKRAEGKLFKVAIIACANKLLHWIFAILTKKEAFILD